MECDNNRRKKIRLVATGGTIASRAAGRVATEGYTPSVIPAEQLLKDLPELSERMDVSCEQIFLKPSSAITESDLFDLSERVNELLMSDECDGVVITHGNRHYGGDRIFPQSYGQKLQARGGDRRHEAPGGHKLGRGA